MDWDEYFLKIAKAVSLKSKDPSTKVGAVLVDADNQIISTGFNGFPRGVCDTLSERYERPIKYQYTTHAEANAIYAAARKGNSVKNSTLYLYGFTMPCTECAKGIIQSGVDKIVCMGQPNAPWADDLKFAKQIMLESGIIIEEML